MRRESNSGNTETTHGRFESESVMAEVIDPEETDETVSDDMPMSPEQIQMRKDILIRRVFAVMDILVRDGLDTHTERYLRDVLTAAKAYIPEAGVSGLLEDRPFVDFVNSLIHATKMIFFEPVAGETRNYTWPEIAAIEEELKYWYGHKS